MCKGRVERANAAAGLLAATKHQRRQAEVTAANKEATAKTGAPILCPETAINSAGGKVCNGTRPQACVASIKGNAGCLAPTVNSRDIVHDAGFVIDGHRRNDSGAFVDR